MYEVEYRCPECGSQDIIITTRKTIETRQVMGYAGGVRREDEYESGDGEDVEVVCQDCPNSGQSYVDHWDVTEQNWIECEICGKEYNEYKYDECPDSDEHPIEVKSFECSSCRHRQEIEHVQCWRCGKVYEGSVEVR